MTGMERYDEQMREATEERDALTSFIASSGWKIVNEWLEQEISIQRRIYEESAPHAATDLYMIGWERGRLSTLRTLQDMPGKLLDSHQQAIDQVNLATGDSDAEER